MKLKPKIVQNAFPTKFKKSIDKEENDL